MDVEARTTSGGEAGGPKHDAAFVLSRRLGVITEFNNTDLKYPFTQIPSGIIDQNGMQGTVSK